MWCFFYCGILAGAGWAQPLVLIGRADAKISGAFAYDFLKSPLNRPMDQGQAEAVFNLPVNASAQAQKFLSSNSDSSVVMPSLFARISQDLNAQVDVSAPLWRGVVFFAARENASLSVSGALGDARLNIDTTLSGTGAVLLKGSIQMPLAFNMSWRSLTFGYAFQPTPLVTLALQLHKHEFFARMSGDLRPDLAGRITVSSDAGNTSFLVDYPDTKVYGTADGYYQGSAWSPEMGLRIGPVKLVSRMGARLPAQGHMDVTYSVPFFIDPKTFEPRFTEPDSFLTSDNLRRLLNSETAKRSVHIRDQLILKLPQSHTLSVDLLPERLTLSYTKVFGQVSIHAETPATASKTVGGTVGNGASAGSGAASGSGVAKDSSATAAGSAGDSSTVDSDGFVDLDLFPDQVICLSGKFGWFHGNVGAHTLNISYRQSDHILTGLSPWEWNGDPWVPILDFGFSWGHPLLFMADFFISPLPAVRTGVSYGF